MQNYILVKEFRVPAFICFMIPGPKRMFLGHWSKTRAMSMVRVEDPGSIKLRKSAWEKLYASTQINASPSKHTVSDKFLIGSR